MSSLVSEKFSCSVAPHDNVINVLRLCWSLTLFQHSLDPSWQIVALYFFLGQLVPSVLDILQVLLSCPYLQHCLWESIHNCTQSGRGTGKVDFPQLFTHFSFFRPVVTAFENF